MRPLRSIFSAIGSILQSYWALHLCCALLLLLSTIPMLWPEWLPEPIVLQAGKLFLICFLVSVLLMVIFVVREFLHLQNQRAILRFISFLFIWVLAGLASIGLTYLAKVPMDRELVEKAPELDIKVYTSNEELMGESSLLIYIKLDEEKTSHINDCSNLVLLESEHPEIFKLYLQHSPRWSENAPEALYAQLSQVEFSFKDQEDKPRGAIQADFRFIPEGQEMPKGYTVAKPGDPLPETNSDTSKRISPDLAIDLGGNYFLLLAWSGVDDRALALQCFNAALRYINASVDSLAKNPNKEQLERMGKGGKKFRKKQAELLLCEPPSQFGTYQAEIYANPREAGQLLLLIKDSKSRDVLRLISCYAKYSDNEQEYFLHEIPADLPNWLGRQEWAPGKLMLSQGIPLFTIKRGEDNISFDADFEVWFAPSDATKSKRLILTKRYRVQSCNYLTDTKLRADEESDLKITQEDATEGLDSSEVKPEVSAEEISKAATTSQQKVKESTNKKLPSNTEQAPASPEQAPTTDQAPLPPSLTKP